MDWESGQADIGAKRNARGSSSTHLHAHHLCGGALCRRLQVCRRLGLSLCQPRLRSRQLALRRFQLLLQRRHRRLVLAAVCLLLLLQEANVLRGGVGALLGLVCGQASQAGAVPGARVKPRGAACLLARKHTRRQPRKREKPVQQPI